jgi:hypothetical protein
MVKRQAKPGDLGLVILPYWEKLPNWSFKECWNQLHHFSSQSPPIAADRSRGAAASSGTLLNTRLMAQVRVKFLKWEKIIWYAQELFSIHDISCYFLTLLPLALADQDKELSQDIFDKLSQYKIPCTVHSSSLFFTIFFLWYWHLNSAFQTLEVGALLLEPHLQPFLLWLFLR